MKSNKYILFSLMLLLLFLTAINGKSINSSNVLQLSCSQKHIAKEKKTAAKNFQIENDCTAADLDQEIDDQFVFHFLSLDYSVLQKNILVTPSLKKVTSHSAYHYSVGLFILYHSLIIP